jgi:D-alanyl-lipoteichoic acid acyltransferase DltB (MBOAT superfamily)
MKKKREFNYNDSVNGIQLFLWGLFKKVVIADNCAILANQIFNNYQDKSTLVLIMGAVYYAFQIYCDFSGYSDMAIGSARLLGFKLTTNFRTPYFSRDVIEFWKRWHISLSTWFRDYLFLPIAYSLTRKLTRKKHLGIRTEKLVFCIAAFLTFLVCGLWHGANWTFIAWGGIIGVYFIPLIFLNHNRKNLDTVAENRFLPTFKETYQIITTFAFICIAWIFFRSDSIENALGYLNSMASNLFFNTPAQYMRKYLLFLIGLFVIAEWTLVRHDNFLERFSNFNPLLRRTIYVCILVLIFIFMQNESTSYIYFQF